MGYFANGSEGEIYQANYCFKCKNWIDKKDGKGYGCAIWDLHILYSYELCNSKSKAKKMLDFLIPDRDCSNEECKMYLPKSLSNDFIRKSTTQNKKDEKKIKENAKRVKLAHKQFKRAVDS